MLKAILPLILLILVSSSVCMADSEKAGINFSTASWAEVKEEAKKTGKFIFVDFYADWCGPCKYMSKKVFTDPAVGEMFNKNFISYKLDAEKQEQAFVEEMQLEAYPTLGFFDPSGKLMLKYVGVLEAGEMLETGQLIYNFSKNEEMVKQGKANASVLEDYLAVLKETDFNKASQIANEYLSALQDDQLKKAENWFFIKNFAYHYSSRAFNFVVNNASDFAAFPDFQVYYQLGAKSLMIEAVEQKDYSKVELHKKYHTQVYKTLGLLKMPEAYYSSLIDVMYFDGINDTLQYFSSLKTWVTSFNMNNAQALIEASVKVSKKLKNKEALETALSWSEAAIGLQDNYSSRFAKSIVLQALGRKKEALAEALLAREKCVDQEVIGYLDQYIESLK